MSCGKYSPTVNASYSRDQEWWYKHKDPTALYDRAGYNSYGYNSQGRDRAGYTEWDYLASGEWIDDEYSYPLYEQVASEWMNKIIF